MLLAPKLKSLHCLLAEQIQDLHDAETRLVKAIPKLVEATECNHLKTALNAHLQETKGHVRRLEEIAKILDVKPDGKTCKAMKGLLEEGDESAHEKGDHDVHDISIITAARKVEHYEISGYTSAREVAQEMGLSRVVTLLEETLREEVAADKKLTEIAAEHITRAPHRRESSK